jgi:hypothetical protein
MTLNQLLLPKPLLHWITATQSCTEIWQSLTDDKDLKFFQQQMQRIVVSYQNDYPSILDYATVSGPYRQHSARQGCANTSDPILPQLIVSQH